MRNNLELMLIEAAKLSENDICVITGVCPQKIHDLAKLLPRKIAKAVELIACHIDLGLKIDKAKNKDATIVYSFSTEFLFLSFLISGWTHNVYLVNNHNIQQAYANSFMNFILKIYHRLRYKFIILEDTDILMNLGYTKQEIEQHTSLLHSVVDNTVDASKSQLLFDRDKANKKKVGIIGEARRGKNFSATLESMLEISKKLDILLIIGTNDFSCFDGLDLQGIELVDTSTNDRYVAALSACDVVVLNYEKSNYFYRCSGVATDAIGVQTYVVCPDFPFMSSQVNYPAKVGVVYQDETGLELALKQALELVGNPDTSGFEMHYLERSLAKTANVIDRAIQSNSAASQVLK